MQAPEFWHRAPTQPGVRARLLSPLGYIYATATARRVARGPRVHTRVPVICVGNINAGGTGKTPTVIALAQRLIESGQSPFVVSRGHRGDVVGPMLVDPRKHTADEVGDEPLLLAAFAPTIVSKDRAKGTELAEASGASVILLDDGHQNPDVKKSLSIVVVDAAKGFGNGHCLPAGPLREPVASGLARAELVLSIGPTPAQSHFASSWGQVIPDDVPRLTGELRTLPMGMPWTGMRVLAFAGIGHPEKFFATLKAEGATLVRGEALEDHQPLTKSLMQRLLLEAKQTGARLVTTEKDAVRLPRALQQEVLTLPVRLHIHDDTALAGALDQLNLEPS